VNALDLIILLILLGVAARGVASGFLRQAGSLGGFVLGLVLGALVAPLAAKLLPAASTGRLLIVLLVFFGIAIVVGGLGEALGDHLSVLAERYRLRQLDSLFGAIFGIVIALITVWLLAPTFARTPDAFLSGQIQHSAIVQALDRRLPPVPDVMARLERSIGVNGFPRVFAGLEPSPAPPVTGPNAAAVNAAAAAGRPATVKIEGLGCGGILEGSGYVAASGLVATNAHVVAGIDAPMVIDAAGHQHAATVVVFDPNLDFAVLRVRGLTTTPLPTATGISPRGTVGAVLGYPGGGDFTVSSAAVLGEQTALGRDIYDSNLTRRDIYQLQSIVRPGNSGGPVVTPDGTVIGVVFAMSTTNGQVGYALTSAEIKPDLQAASNAGPTSTGACVSD
jgi:S1-C subfamily serine protease